MKIKFIDKVLKYIGLKFAKFPATLLMKTLRVEKNGFEEIEDLEMRQKNYVVAFWHGYMLAAWYVFRKKNICAVVSQSKDGEILSNVLKYWKYELIRGSSSKGGKEVLREALNYANNGKIIAMTPDGPRGPIYNFKPGAVIIAQRASIPLFLVAIKYSKFIEFNSWDKFKFPFPFTKVTIKAAGPFLFEKNLSRSEMDEQIKKMENILNWETEKLNVR